jgi:hypothetical protein
MSPKLLIPEKPKNPEAQREDNNKKNVFPLRSSDLVGSFRRFFQPIFSTVFLHPFPSKRSILAPFLTHYFSQRFYSHLSPTSQLQKLVKISPVRAIHTLRIRLYNIPTSSLSQLPPFILNRTAQLLTTFRGG